ncbi:FKBP-type peptidyl-prolyl cis-trans isomerase [Candidatus Woesearchaeota archaeon]|nr:FKBP-type peptidyl-prolyl cis-trans isomerase [Candidatus Woesearchaeota archaeon]
MTDKADDDALTIDFSGVKKFFGSLADKVKKPKKEESDDELSLDWGRAFAFCRNHPVMILLVVITILQFVPNAGFLPWGGLWMRLMAQDLPIVQDWATNSVYNYYRNQISGAISQQYPNLPDANKAKLIDEQLSRLLKGQENEVRTQIEGTANYLKGYFQYEANGRTFTYMPDIDPYFYLRRTERLLSEGDIADRNPEGGLWDYQQLAPDGVRVDKELHYYSLAILHKIMALISPGITPMQSVTYLPIVLVTASVVLAFLVGNRLAGPVAGIFSATMLSINSAGVGRTVWGHADTDGYNLLFPLLIVYLLIEYFEAPTVKKKVFWMGLVGFGIGLYAFSWSGYWYMFDFILAALGLYLAYVAVNAFREKRSMHAVWGAVQPVAASIGLYIGSSWVFVRLFTNVPFFLTFLSPFRFTTIKSAAHADLWPNVYTTVAELNPINVEGIINVVGGRLLFGLAILGIILLAMRRHKQPHYVQYTFLLTIWFLSTMYASTKGIRFTLLLVPAFAIAFGVCAGLALSIIKTYARKHISLPNFITIPLVMALFVMALLYSEQVQGSYGQARNSIPIVDDAWYNALTAIRDKSPENAIVNSWWDFGHHFKYFTKRGVTFDGGTQNSPMAHWIGRVLLTENEDEAVGILRMLDCGSHLKAWNALYPQTNNDTVRAVRTLYKIFPVHDKARARDILVNEQIENPDAVLDGTHCTTPPENYLIVSEDMIGKSGVWSHFGSWNFERAYVWLVLRQKPREEAVQYMMDNFNYTKQFAEQVYYDVKALPDENAANQWISPWPGYASGVAGCDFKGPQKIECGNGVQADLQRMDARVVAQGNTGIPKYLVYINETTKAVQKAEYNNSNMNIAVILIPRGNGYAAVLSSPELAASMFTRLFFMEGNGLRYFEPLTSQHQITGGDIRVYKTDWTAKEPIVISALKPKTTVNAGDRVSINYIGFLQNGTVFDASVFNWTTLKVSAKSDFSRLKTAPMTYIAGAGQTIKGFDDAVIGMNVSEVKTFNVTPEQGYGTDPTKHPLANQTLFFKVKVEEIR